MSAPIHHTFGPLATSKQFWQAFFLQFQPWKWKNGPESDELKEKLSQMFNRSAHLFDTGRGALLALLRSMELQPGEEVILQGYTCTVVPNAIVAAGGKPIYVDINPNNLNMDPSLVRKAISPRTRAIICQHTFGIPADTSALRLICEERDIALIEDCAHIIPSKKDKNIGNYGDALIFSFGRDKAISGVTGGAVLTKHEFISSRLNEMEKNAVNHSLWHILNLIDYPLRYTFAKMIWPLKVAKVYLKWIRWIHLLPPVLKKEEKEGMASVSLHRMPNACAALALRQLNRLDVINMRRSQLSNFYLKMAKQYHWEVPLKAESTDSLQKFPLLHKNAEDIRASLKKHEIYLDDGWCGAVVNPRSVNQKALWYSPGQCPQAEKISHEILTLPTHPTMTMMQARRLVELLKDIY